MPFCRRLVEGSVANIFEARARSLFGVKLALSYHVCGLDPIQCCLGRVEGLEAKHGARDPLYERTSASFMSYGTTLPTTGGPMSELSLPGQLAVSI